MVSKDPNVFPHDDENMIFDELLNQYVLTEKGALNLAGINLSVRVNTRKNTNSNATIRVILEQVSMQIYGFIHQHCVDNSLQDRVIAKCPSARPIIQRAMLNQLLYYLQVGNLSRSTDKEKRALAIDETAKKILLKPIMEIGHSLCYVGRWNCGYFRL